MTHSNSSQPFGNQGLGVRDIFTAHVKKTEKKKEKTHFQMELKIKVKYNGTT